MDNNEIILPVIKVAQRIGTFYLAAISAKELVRISYADVRRIEERDVEKYLGIQRPLDEKRVKQIKKYLSSPDASFPTGIVLSIDQKCTEFDEAGQLLLKPYNGEFPDEESIPIDKIAKILDGQHRIAAFVNEDWEFDETLWEAIGSNFEFNVDIFIGLDIDEQANIFATVNLAQTKVNRSLVYDLEGLSKTRSPFRTCHQIAVALDSADPRSPLFERIKRLGVKTKNRESSEPLTQAAFVESLVKLISRDPFADRILYLKGKKPQLATEEELKKYPFRNLFIEEKDKDIALIVYNYFSAIKKKWSQAWTGKDVEGNILPRSNAFKAFMRFLKKVYIELVGSNIGEVPTIEQFENVFSNINASDNDFTSGNFKPGSAGESSFYKLLLGEVTIQELKN
ncbi:MAG TPA: DGQHR domain-containing protein [Chitinophagaceae bacterium]|jgi:DGQHR domain-containing protein|nr:DGQHR domain-containing protein [Chitinophagaceae bacterium]